jgi:Cu/Zn superoxide dismutase
VRRIIKAALGGLAGCALVLGATQMASGEAPVTTTTYGGDLVDASSDYSPFDGAKATLRVIETPAGSTFKLRVSGIDAPNAGPEHGAHLHTGWCVEDDNGLAAGPHYNTDVLPGGLSYADAVKSPKTEVWFQLIADEDGTAEYQAAVPFVPKDLDGVMSIIIHRDSTTAGTGAAGPRQACFEFDVPKSWVVEPPPTG